MADLTDSRKWMQRAEQDLKLIELITRNGIEGLEDSFCYICHQAAEKLLKAFILKCENTVPKTHDLIFLLGKCQKYDNSLIKLADALAVLNEYSVSARYPSDFEDKRALDDCKEAYGCICEVKNALHLIFSKNGD